MFYWLIAALWFRTVLKWTVSEAFKSYRICIAYTIWNERFTNDRIRKWLIATLFHCIYPYWNWRFPKHLNCIGSVLITYINYFILTFPRNLNCIGAVIRQQFFQRLVLPIKFKFLTRQAVEEAESVKYWNRDLLTRPWLRTKYKQKLMLLFILIRIWILRMIKADGSKKLLVSSKSLFWILYYTTYISGANVKNIGIRTSNNMLLYFFGNNREGTLLNLTNFWNL